MPRRTPLVAAILLVAALTPSASAVSRPRADLEVRSGDVAVAGTRVHGSFTVVNRGTKRAPASSAAIKVDGKRVRSVATPGLRPGQQRVVRFSVRVGGGTHRVGVCADRRREVTERREGNNCRRLGRVTLESTSVPTDPIDYDPDTVFQVGASPDEYWLHVPKSYDDSHRTPVRLVVFVHGCGSRAEDQVRFIDDYVDGAADHLVMSPGLGHDGQCWDAEADAGPLLDAIADVKSHFNVDPKRVVIGGYSSGSTLAGKVAFAHASSFAGLIVVPGRPFWSSADRTSMLANAAWKLNVAWRAHTSDEYYPIADLRGDRRALQDAGFPTSFSEVAGTHAYTQEDFSYLFAKLDGWTAP